jgi:pyruvate/2-oxoglutarate dehydrogenase complex dihydrolipoamide dehydrogenase (E3) component
VLTGPGEQTIQGSDILVTAGRRPKTAGIGLDIADVALDERGYIKVNDSLETSAPDVWALGECAGSPQFTHVSFDDFPSFGIISQAEIAPRASAWCPIACSRTHHSPGSD